MKLTCNSRIIFIMMMATTLPYLNGYSTKISSLQDLRTLDIPGDCISNANTDCKSPNTGNIYPNSIIKEATVENFN